MTFVIDFEKVFNDYMASNQKYWEHDRSTTVGASEAFNCLRQLVYEKRHKEFGAEPDEDYVERWGATERGNLIENHFVVPAMAHLPDGLDFHLGGTHQVTHVLSRNSATPDGLITGVPSGPVEIKYGDLAYLLPEVTSGCIGLEIKSIDPRAQLEEERTKHAFQSQIGIGMIRETTQWKPDYWVILYVDAAWLDHIKPFVITYDPKVFETAKKRAHKVYEVDDPQKVMPEGKIDGGCKYCRWKRACGQAFVDQIDALSKKDEIDEVGLAIADTMVRDVLSAKADMDAATERYEFLRQEMKDWLVESGRSKIGSEEWTVTWYTMPGRKTLDKRAMTADGIDLSKYEMQGASYDVLKIIDRNKGN